MTSAAVKVRVWYMEPKDFNAYWYGKRRAVYIDKMDLPYLVNDMIRMVDRESGREMLRTIIDSFHVKNGEVMTLNQSRTGTLDSRRKYKKITGKEFDVSLAQGR